MLRFELNNLTRRKVNMRWLRLAVAAFAGQARLAGRNYFSLALVGPAAIKKWNRLYRRRDKVTDVLSFAETADEPKLKEAKGNYLGEILICPAQAGEQAKEYGSALAGELSRLLIHGLAHLVGYEHEGVSKKKAQEMRDFEENVARKMPKLNK